MARVYWNGDGYLLRFDRDEVHEGRYPSPPPGSAGSLPFDPTTNLALVRRLDTDWQGFRFTAGALRYRGTVVTPNASGQAYQDLEDLPAVLAKLNLPAAVITPAEYKLMLRVIFRTLRRLV